MQDIINGRCGWCGTDRLYVKYHDEEWGKPVSDDNVLFEFLVLESAQAGLNWLTILKKREGYRRAFCNFSIELTAQMSDEEADCQPFPLLKRGSRLIAGIRRHQQRYEKTGF